LSLLFKISSQLNTVFDTVSQSVLTFSRSLAQPDRCCFFSAADILNMSHDNSPHSCVLMARAVRLGNDHYWVWSLQPANRVTLKYRLTSVGFVLVSPTRVAMPMVRPAS
jgi:hypothetical protein